MSSVRADWVLAFYLAYFQKSGMEAKERGNILQHAMWVTTACGKLPLSEKMRWLGFVQGVLVSHGLFTIDELKSHNKPPARTSMTRVRGGARKRLSVKRSVLEVEIKALKGALIGLNDCLARRNIYAQIRRRQNKIKGN